MQNSIIIIGIRRTTAKKLKKKEIPPDINP
jgi:hypothetical protein